MSHPSFTLLIPLFNELAFIRDEFERNWTFLKIWKEGFTIEVRFCVWSSEEAPATVTLLRELISSWSSQICFEVLEGGENAPSVVGSLQVGLTKPIKTPFVLICPVDCSPTLEGLRETHSFISNQQGNNTHWGVFRKKYNFTNLPLKISSSMQNRVLAPVFSLHCWTNLFFVRREYLTTSFAKKLFLEDLYANRELHSRFGRPHRFRTYASVSARRYLKRGSLWQILINCKTFVRYLFNVQDLSALRRSYESDSKS